MTALAAMLMADRKNFAKTLLTGFLVGGIVTLATGLIDLAAASTGLESLLKPFRNAQYALLTGDAVSGVRKVVGFAPEASVYGPMCVQFAAALTLLRSTYAEGLQRTLATIVGVSLIVMAVLSTSSAAYAGLALLGAIYLVNFARRAMFSQVDHNGLAWEFVVGIALMGALLFTILVRNELFDPLLNLIEEQVFNKSLTGSYYERSYWNTVAWNALASTWGLGVGFGSTRTSNWVAAVASNTGLIGAAFMAIFLIQLYVQRTRYKTVLFAELLPTLKLSLLPALAMECLVSGGPDFGPWVAVIFGAITGIATLNPERRSVRQIASDVSGRTQMGADRASL